MPENSHRSPDTPLTYKVLLVLTTLSSVLFCWLYVTKPTQIHYEEPKPETALIQNPTPPSYNNKEADNPIVADPKLPPITSPTQSPTDFIPPSNDDLPSASTNPLAVTPVSPSTSNDPISLPNSASTKNSSSWEETNDRIQHVISAQSNDQSERIIIEVPVIYQTRGLRLGPEQAAEARRILRALESYKALINNLHQDGKNIAKAWEQLLLDAQPIDALRADSPSLPQSNNPKSQSASEKSSATISIKNQK